MQQAGEKLRCLECGRTFQTLRALHSHESLTEIPKITQRLCQEAPGRCCHNWISGRCETHTDEARQLGQEAKYEAKHALFLSQYIKDLDKTLYYGKKLKNNGLTNLHKGIGFRYIALTNNSINDIDKSLKFLEFELQNEFIESYIVKSDILLFVNQ